MRIDIEQLRRAIAGHIPRRIDPAAYTSAAVLIGLVDVGEETHFLLTRRTDTVDTHKGQVAFPGGSLEPGEDAVAAALREAEEEIGLDPARAEIVGFIDDMRTPSGFVVTPVVARVTQTGGFRLSEREVARVFTAPVRLFLDERNARIEKRMLRGEWHDVYFYEHDGETIWGVTAIIIRNFIRHLPAPA